MDKTRKGWLKKGQDKERTRLRTGQKKTQPGEDRTRRGKKTKRGRNRTRQGQPEGEREGATMVYMLHMCRISLGTAGGTNQCTEPSPVCTDDHQHAAVGDWPD